MILLDITTKNLEKQAKMLQIAYQDAIMAFSAPNHRGCSPRARASLRMFPANRLDRTEYYQPYSWKNREILKIKRSIPLFLLDKVMGL